MSRDLSGIAQGIAHAASERGLRVVTAESVTAGSIATALAAADDASSWFCGGIVAYHTETKRRVLGVTAERIISAECATQLAEGALRLTGADLVVTVTGVGGPDPEEGRPAGTVIICAGTPDDLRVFEHAFDGEPAEVVDLATEHALRHLRDAAAGPGRAG